MDYNSLSLFISFVNFLFFVVIYYQVKDLESKQTAFIEFYNSVKQILEEKPKKINRKK